MKCKVMKIASLAAFALAAVVLIWGAVASGLDYSNRKQDGLTTAVIGYDYDGVIPSEFRDSFVSADGKIYLEQETLTEDEAVLYTNVDFTKELISGAELKARILKLKKILTVTKAEKALAAAKENKAGLAGDDLTNAVKAAQDDLTDAQNTYRIAEWSYNASNETKSVSSAQSFFSTFFPAAVLLLIAGFVFARGAKCREQA